MDTGATAADAYDCHYSITAWRTWRTA